MSKRKNKPDLVDEVVTAFAAERPDLPERLVETTSRLIYAGRLMEDLAARTIQALGFHYTDFDVLGMLRVAGKPYELTPADLMRKVMITSGAMTACLKRLERGGMIRRRTDDRDRRIKHVRLTAKGRALADDALTRRYDASAAVISSLTEAEITTLNALLRKTTDCAG